MPKKQQAFANKLGSWTDQANLTRNQPTTPLSSQERYLLKRGLIDRIAEVAAAQGMTPQEVVGHLLTWALDQVELGLHVMPGKDGDGSSK